MQICNSRRLAGKFYFADHSSNATCWLSLSIHCLRISSGRHKQHRGVNAARIGLHTCVIVRDKIVTKSNKLLQLVTLRKNTSSSQRRVKWNLTFFLRFFCCKMASNVLKLVPKVISGLLLHLYPCFWWKYFPVYISPSFSIISTSLVQSCRRKY